MVIRFSLDTLPKGMAMKNAVLSLYCLLDEWPLAANSGYLFSILRAWDDRTVSWYSADSLNPWPGGGDVDYSTVVTFERTRNDGSSSWEDFNVTGFVSAGYADSSKNHGYLLAVASGDGHGYASSEYSAVDLRPKLAVELDTVVSAEKRRTPEKGPPLFTVDAARAVLRLENPGPFHFTLADLNGKIIFTRRGFSAGGETLSFRLSPALSGKAPQVLIAALFYNGKRSARTFVTLR